MDGAAERPDAAPPPGVALPLALWAGLTAALAGVSALELSWGWWIAPAAWGAWPVGRWLWRGPEEGWGIRRPEPLGRSIGELVLAAVAVAAAGAWVASWAPMGNFTAGWVVIACCWVPCLEELFFRGWLQGALRARWGRVSAVLASAVLFGLSHAAVAPLSAGLATVAPALLFGVVRERQGSLAGAVVLHGVANCSVLWFSHAPL